MWWVTSQKTGESAIGLQQALGLGSYETAWTWLHKLRRAMVRPGRDRLTGRVQVDETYLGGLEEGVRGRQTEKKALIAVAVEELGEGIGRIRMRRIPDASADSLEAFIKEAVAPGSLLHTDGFLSYDRLEKHGYRHRITFLKGRKESASRAPASCASGSSGPIKAPLPALTWTTTSTSSPSGSIGGRPGTVENFFTGLYSKASPSSPRRTSRLLSTCGLGGQADGEGATTTNSGHLSQGDTPKVLIMRTEPT